MSTTARPRWYVVCESYTVGPLTTEESAQRQLAGIEKLGACQNEHRVEQK